MSTITVRVTVLITVCYLLLKVVNYQDNNYIPCMYNVTECYIYGIYNDQGQGHIYFSTLSVYIKRIKL